MDSTTKLLIIQIVLAVASRFFTGIAVYTDSKLTHIKHDRIVTAIVAGILADGQRTNNVEV